jgi:hypothetical protein
MLDKNYYIKIFILSVYKVGSTVENVWSETFVFKTMRDGNDWSPHVALYGDFGFSNHQSLQRLMIDNDQGMYDAVFHVGKFHIDTKLKKNRLYCE